MRPARIITCGSVAMMMLSAASLRAATVLPEGFSVEPVITSGLHYPTSFALAPNGLGFIAEKGGTVRVVRNGSLLATPFVDLSAEVNAFGDRGLAGLALHPEFPKTPFVYLSFSYDPPGLPGAEGEVDGPDGKGRRVSRVIRLSADAAAQYERAIPDSETVLAGTNSTLESIGDPGADGSTPVCVVDGVTINDCLPSDSAAHGVDALRFGPDGALYFGHGDGSNPMTLDLLGLRAQNLASASGKMFRIDPATGEGFPDNPYFDGDVTHNRSKVFAYGLRNPFRVAFEPSTGELFTGDVGWNSWEEIDRGGGRNFGWPCFEGALRAPAFEFNSAAADICIPLYESDAATPPLYSYHRPDTGGALILGDFYVGTKYPAEYRSALFFADFNDQWIRYLVHDGEGGWEARPFAWYAGAVVQMSVGADENLYVLSIDPAMLYRIVYHGSNRPPEAYAHASTASGPLPLVVQFSSAGSKDADGDELFFLWSFDDGESSSDRDVVHTFASARSYNVRLTVRDEHGAEAISELKIEAGVSAPSVSILSPLLESEYVVGEAIRLEGRAVDRSGIELGGASLQWEGVLHHAGHTHPGAFSASGTTATVAMDDHGDDTWLEILLTARDASGMSAMASSRLRPRLAPIALESEPAGQTLVYESDSRAAPFNVSAPVGGRRTITAPAVQDHRSFARWSDGGARSHVIEVKPTFQVFTAYYENQAPVALIDAAAQDDDPFEYRFDASASRDPEGDQLTYEWDFGDETGGSTLRTMTHRFPAPGIYPVKLVVTDEVGKLAGIVVSVRVAVAAGRLRPVRP
jgi:glucose/arabinose dehydrogenase/PKD repeat protein